MNEFDDLEQKLWELEYGLLPDDEASALRRRIADDPEVASVHRRVCSQSALVAEAARVEVPRIQLQRTAATEPATKDAVARSATPTMQRDRFEFRRLMNWAIAVAASLLVAMLGFAVVGRNQTPATDVAFVAEETREFAIPALAAPSVPAPVVIEVEGARVMQRGIANRLQFNTKTPQGIPQSAELQVKTEDVAGNVTLDAVVPTDTKGRGWLVMPPSVVEKAVKLEVAEVNQSFGSLAVPLATAPETYVTFLTTDRPRYRPGDTVRFRSVTLSKFGLNADREVQVDFAITDPVGNTIAAGNQSGTTTQGVGNGEFTVAPDSVGGKYTVLAQNASNLFPAASCGFYVQPDPSRQWELNVNWYGNTFAPGSTPKAKVVVQSLDGKPAAELPVRAEAFVDGHQVNIPNAPTRTNAQGEADFELQLPADIQFGEGKLSVAPGDEEFQDERIPIRVPKIAIDFYPEGGDLVAGVESRVYFHAHDALGMPATCRGRVLDGGGAEVASFGTQHEGRGVFRFTPQAAESYRLEITDPPQTTSDSQLPAVGGRANIVLDCGPGVFGPQDAIAPKMTAKDPPENLMVVAKCRDAMVGHVSVAKSDFVNGSCSAPLPLAAEAAGVIRVTVFDREQPIAERLIYRQAPKRLTVQIQGAQPSYAPASQVHLAFSCVNEAGKPTAAALGVGVVDDALLKLAHPAMPRMATYFSLWGDVASPEKLEDANFYLTESPASQAALDLLLGTQGWRRFENIADTRLAYDNLAARDGLALGRADQAERQLTVIPLGDEGTRDRYRLSKSLVDPNADLPFRIDNTAVLEKQVQSPLPNPAPVVVRPAVIPAAKPTSHDRWLVTIFSSIVVLAFSLAGILLGLASSRRTAIAGVAVSAIVLAISLFGHLAPLRQRPSPTAASAVASSASRAEGADQMYEALQTPKQQAITDLESRTSNAPASGSEPADSPTVVDPHPVPDAAPVESASTTPSAEPRRSRVASQVEPDLRVPGPQLPPAATEAAPNMARQPGRAASQLEPSRGGEGRSLPPTAQKAAASTATTEELSKEVKKLSELSPPPSPKAAAAETVAPKFAEPPAPASPVPPPSPVGQADQAPPLPAKQEAAGFGGVAAKGMIAPAEAPPAPQAARAPEAKDVVEQKSANWRGLGVQAESEEMRRQRLTTDSVYRERRAVRGRSQTEKGTVAEPQLEDAVRLQTADRKAAAATAGGALAGGMKLKSNDTDNFYVRLYAHQNSNKRDADKKVPDYTETVYWNPLLITDANGRAEVVFELSDAVTKYRVLIDAHQDGRITSTTGEIETK